MNILQILPELNVGGVETGTVDLAGRLAALGHKAVVVSAGGRLVKELESRGASHYRLPVHKKSLFNIVRMIRPIEDIIRKERIDIVHARSRAPAWPAFFACRRTGAVFVTTCHGYYGKHFFSKVMGWGKRVIVPGNVIGRHMMDDFGVPHDRIRLVPRGVGLSRFKYTPPDEKRKDPFNVGIIGRITPLKGHLFFIKGMAKLARIVPDLKVWVVGDAPESKAAYKEQLLLLTRRLGLWNCTSFLGTQKDIPSVLSGLDLLVLATTTPEAFGRVVIEAQASGVPVVASKVGGVVDIIEDGVTGLLVPPADPASIALAAARIYRDPKLARRLAEAAYAKVRSKYTAENMAEATLKVYEECLNERRALIIKLSSIGDAVLTSAAIAAVKRKLGPGFRLSLLTGEPCREVFLRCPYIDDLIVCDLRNKDKGLRGIMKWGAVLRRGGFDMVIDFQNNRKSHLLSWLSAAGRRLGYRNGKLGSLLNCGVKDDKICGGPVEHQFRVLEPLGIAYSGEKLEFWPDASDEDSAQEVLSQAWVADNQVLVGINISASRRWTSKNWPPEKIVGLINLLCGRDIRVVLTGTEEEKKQADKIIASVKSPKAVINACGRTADINQLACLIGKCKVFVSCDSAALHAAAARGVPLAALFGPTDPRRHLPPSGQCEVIQRKLKCSPCYKPVCRKKATCMSGISPEDVFSAVCRLMS